MMHYSIEPGDHIFVKGYGFLFFAKHLSKNSGKNVSKNLSAKYSQKLLDHPKHFAIDALEAVSKRAIQKTAETTGDLIGNKIAKKSTKYSPQNNSETHRRTEEKSNNIHMKL